MSELYSREETLGECLGYFNGNEMEATTFMKKYALKKLGEDKFYEKDPDDMHRRLASEFARIEAKYPNPLTEDEIYSYLKGFEKIIPNGSIMAGLGNEEQLMSISNCFVVGNKSDSYAGIMKTDQELVQLMKRRAGVGTDISHLRPRGTVVRNASRTSTGAASFMERFSESTREVAQEGRRGALMLTIDIRHPDAEEFIDKKMDETSVTGANVSVRLTDEFVEAAWSGETFAQRYPIHEDPDDADMTKEIDAAKLWDKIVSNAHESAEPGVMFWDRIIEESPADCYADLGFETLSTNPCGEVPLNPYDSCRLTAMNLLGFVKNPFTEDAYFDFNEFREAVRVAQRIMDDVVDLEIQQVNKIIDKVKSDPEPESVKRTELELWKKIREKAKTGRRTGLGLTALGDTLAALGIRYGSDESIEVAEKIVREQKLSAFQSSVEMAKERGSFEIYDANREEDCPFIQRIASEDPELYEEMTEHGRRNIAVLSIAPTGTVSMMAQTTSGVENLYEAYYIRSRKVNANDENVEVDYVDEVGDAWQEFPVFHKRFKDWLEIQGHDIENVKDLDRDEIDELVSQSPYAGATVEDVDWVNKVRMQGAIQQHIDHSISVTTNLPEDIDVETTKEVYEVAYKSGCKGQTIYRQGSRSGVLNQESQADSRNGSIVYNDAPERPDEVECDIHQVRYDGEPWKILVGRLDDKPYEVFAIKTGGDTGIRFRFTNSEDEKIDEGIIKKRGSGNYDLESKDGKTIIEDIANYAPDDNVRVDTRLLSLNLRHGVKPEYLVEQLEKANGSVVSFGRAMLKALRAYLDVEPGEVCPECGSEEGLTYQEGCVACRECSYSRCG